MAMLKIAVGCDPNAASAKAALMQYLGQKGFLLTDFGSDDPIYANVAIKVAEAVSRKEYDRGILICGTGLGAVSYTHLASFGHVWGKTYLAHSG